MFNHFKYLKLVRKTFFHLKYITYMTRVPADNLTGGQHYFKVIKFYTDTIEMEKT